MKRLTHFFRTLHLAYYRWALREIRPDHADVPHIVARINYLNHN